MKIVTILGSPKGKGAGYRIARRIEDAMRKIEDVEVEYLFLRGVNLEQCRGCFLCVTQGEERCPISDDRVRIEKQIDRADGVILVSPCYVSSVSAEMKNFIDRMCYTNHRPRFFRQKLLLVANGGSGMEKTLEALRLALGSGPRIAGEISYLTPPWPLAPQVDAKQEKRIRRQAHTFIREIRKDLSRQGLPEKPTFDEYLRFRFFRRISADTREYLRKDYDYYKDLGDYYFTASISLWKRITATVVLRIGVFLMKDLSPASRNPGVQ